jgi:dipeptidyl aminopeptidase/acylaminoacyl peptidase
MPREIAPYGSWSSPITAEAIARGSVGLSGPELANGAVWWIESRPAEGGRLVIVRAELDGSGRADVIPADFSARTRVHEYGGVAYLVHGDAVLFSNDDDGRLYRVGVGIGPGGQPEPVTPEPPAPRAIRYADGDAAPGSELTYWVRETHRDEGEPVNEIVAVAAQGGEPLVVATGADFYAAPRVSPDGTRLAFLSWDHPRMPWDGTELWEMPIGGGEPRLVAGGPEVSVVSPAWSPDGVLHYSSDETGWWNLYGEGAPLHPAEAEFGAPLWVFGQSTFAFLDNGLIACTWTSGGFPNVGLLDPATGELEEREPTHVPDFRSPRIRTDGQHVAWVGASPEREDAVVVVDPDASRLAVIATSAGQEPDAGYVSQPEPVEFESHGRTAHALFYPPRNADFEAPPGELPPLLVQIHGGPTSQAQPGLSLETLFWTTRGFAVVDVNYGGSTGYGRAYRELLRGQWGVVDLQDCTEAALYLGRAGRADPDQLGIRGGSAGGYTSLCALTFTDAFDAGASYFGVADINALLHETHKFESRYMYALVPPDKADERSPINAVDRISAPVIIFQGLEDAVVPPAQAELIVEALKKRGIEHEYHAYEGEGHGFRKAETIINAMNAELAFYRRVLSSSSG